MTVSITEGQVQRALTRHFGGLSGRCLMFPNIVHGTYERDVLRLMRSGYWHEIEIKRSVSDFQADFQKSYQARLFPDKQSRTKHEIMQCGEFPALPYFQDRHCQPKRFYFALASEIVDQCEVPEPYGILVYYRESSGRIQIRASRNASDLPNPETIDSETRQRFMTSIYYRYWGVKNQ